MRSMGRYAFIVGLLAAFALASQASGQSLDPRNPTPLQPGENHGTIDNQTGAQYWALHYNPGAANIAVRFTSMGIFGNPMTATVNVLVLGPGGKMIGHQALTSTGQPAQLQWPGKFDKSGVWVIEIQPMGSNIVRNDTSVSGCNWARASSMCALISSKT